MSKSRLSAGSPANEFYKHFFYYFFFVSTRTRTVCWCDDEQLTL